ncbi:MAG: VOC family protein [Gemmatimonadaceae bacterium]|nr:VOC family protein [Gemmatimonadaceae bacterium]
MTVHTHDDQGDAARVEPATPGSYGEAPRGYRLPAATRLGPVHLQVADLARSLPFYEQVLGLHPVAHEASHVTLAAHGDDTPLVELHERPGARRAPPRGRLGLYHVAIRLPDRPSLGRFVRHLAATGARAGAADHLVSEALYLQDPDNLGIEVYADRPRDTWRRVGRELAMATDPLDAADLVRAAGDSPSAGMPAGTTIGHVHLHVGDIARAADFYAEALGFDRIVWHYPGALFLSAGGYHHHLGTNIWAGSGATPPAEDDAQLLEWTIDLPDQASLDAAAESLSRAGYQARWDRDARIGPQLVAHDPWGTTVRLRAVVTAVPAPGAA